MLLKSYFIIILLFFLVPTTLAIEGDLYHLFLEMQDKNPSLLGAQQRLELHTIQFLKATGDYSSPLNVQPSVQLVEGEEDRVSFSLVWEKDNLLGEDRLRLSGGWTYAIDSDHLENDYSLDYSILLFPSLDLQKERAYLDYSAAKEEYRREEMEVLKELLHTIGDLLFKEREYSMEREKLELLSLNYKKDEREYAYGLILPTVLEASRRDLKRQEEHLLQLAEQVDKERENYLRLTGEEELSLSLESLAHSAPILSREREEYLAILLESPAFWELELREELATLSLERAQRELSWQSTLNLSYRDTPSPMVPDWEIILSFRRSLFHGRGRLELLEQEIIFEEERRYREEMERELIHRFRTLWETLIQLEREVDYAREDQERALKEYQNAVENLAKGFISPLDYREASIQKEMVQLQFQEALWQRIYTYVDFLTLLGLSAEDVVAVLQREIPSSVSRRSSL